MDKKSTATVESWNTLRRGDGDASMICYVVQNGQRLTANSSLRLLEPLTYLDRESGLCQIDGHLYRLGVESDRSRTVLKRLAAQIAA